MKWTKTSDALSMRAVRTPEGTPPTAMWEVHRRGPSTYVLLKSLLAREDAPGLCYVAASSPSTWTGYPRRAKVFATTSRRDGCYRAARRLESPKVEKKPEAPAEPLSFLDRAIEVLAGLPRARVLAAHDALWPGETRSARKTRRVNSLQMRLRLAMELYKARREGGLVSPEEAEREAVLKEPLLALFIEARKRTPRGPPPVIKRILSDANQAFHSAVESTGGSR